MGPATRFVVVILALTAACDLQASVAAGADANRGSCGGSTEASPGFRPYAPDCRAYELVTPPYKAGSVTESLQGISSDGSKLIVTSYGGFAGTENNEQGRALFGAGIYELSRSTYGWSAEALPPPATMVSHSGYVTASTDLSSTLWELVEPPEPPSSQSPPEKELLEGNTRFSLAIRVHKAGGTPRFEPVGPENPTTETRDFRDFALQGASQDLSHLVFSIENREGATWPGDSSEGGAESLYEYVGKDNTEPRLVGVKNLGVLNGHPHVNEGAELISNCGTYLGAPSASRYNAVSNTGDVVFFTALECAGGPTATTLFVRVNEESTVSVSEPKRPISANQGSGPGPEECNATCEGVTAKEAVFQGAAEDGTKVFFTTTQSLLNEDEGGTGEGNDLYEAEIHDGQLAKLVQVSHDPNAGQSADLLGVVRISADGGGVYYVANGALTGANADGIAPVNGKDNLYVYNTANATTQFIAALSAEDGEDWKTEDNRRTAQTTHDGRFLLFFSVEKLSGAEDTSTVQQLFEYDAETESLARVSIGQQSSAGTFCPVTKHFEPGFDCDGNITVSALSPAIPLASFAQNYYPVEAISTLAVTDDGRVFFMSRAPLTPLAVEGSKNIYEYSHENVYLVAAGENPQLETAVFQESFNEHDRLLGTDESGNDLFFGAVGQLVPHDMDTQSDIYDARVEGGFADVQPVQSCEGAECRGGRDAVPVLLPALSVSATGEGGVQALVKPTTTPKSLTKAQKLARALRLCKKKARSRRHQCETQARKRYGAAAVVKTANREGK